MLALETISALARLAAKPMCANNVTTNRPRLGSLPAVVGTHAVFMVNCKCKLYCIVVYTYCTVNSLSVYCHIFFVCALINGVNAAGRPLVAFARRARLPLPGIAAAAVKVLLLSAPARVDAVTAALDVVGTLSCDPVGRQIVRDRTPRALEALCCQLSVVARAARRVGAHDDGRKRGRLAGFLGLMGDEGESPPSFRHESTAAIVRNRAELREQLLASPELRLVDRTLAAVYGLGADPASLGPMSDTGCTAALVVLMSSLCGR